MAKGKTGTQGPQVERPTWAPAKLTTACACGEVFDGPEPRRCSCGRVHDPAGRPPVDAVAVIREYLTAYAGRCGLPWAAPDDAICQQVLAAAGGLEVAIKHLRDLADGRMAPSRSWGWFPVVVGRRAVNGG